MAILNQNSQSQTFFAGWYGTCDAECQNLNISTSSFRDKIYKIYQIRDDNLTYDAFDGVVPQNLDDTVQVFTEFECGKYYIIILKSGTGQVDLPDFKEVNNGSLDAGRVTQSCEPTYELIDLLGYDGNLNETDFNSPVIQLITNRVEAGTPVPFTIHGSNITLEDFVGLNSLQGTFIVGSNGSNGNYLLSNLNLKIAEDSTTEGPETFRISLDNHPDVYLDMTILDTSHQPHTYLLEEADGYVSVSENSPSNITTINLITTELIGSIIPFNLSGSGITIEDFTGTIPVDSSIQGNFQITDTISSGDNAGKNLGQVTFEIAEDSTTEGPETFTIALSDHPEVFLDMTILDTSTSPPTYTLSSTESADEGSVVTLTLETTGVDTGTPVPFTIHGSNITLEDFVGLNSLGAGEFVIDSNGDATFSLEIKADSTTEGPETFTVTLDDHPDIFVDVTINDTSQTPVQLVLSATHNPIDEGDGPGLWGATEIMLSTDGGTSLTPGDTHKIKLTGSGITPDDFEGWSYLSDENNVFTFDSSMEVDFVVDNNGYADSVMLYTRADSTTEGPETVRVILVDDPNVFVDIDINDTSQTPHTYLLENAGDYSFADETDFISLTINLITTETIGSFIPFTVSGSGITLEDFSSIYPAIDSNLQGSFEITGTISSGDNAGKNFGQVTFNIVEDSTTEGTEVFTITVDDHKNVSFTIDIEDTSQTPLNLQLTSLFNPIDEDWHTEIELSNVDGTPLPLGDLYTFTISGSNITPDDFVGWGTHDQLYGGGSYTPFDSNLDGILTVDSGGTASIEIKTRADSTTEGPEIFTVTLDDYPSVSIDIDINDTSTPQLVLTADFPSPPIDEGTHTKILLNWTEQNLTPGDSYDFVITGSNITPDDFEYWLDPSGVQQQFDGSLQGTLVVNSNGNAFTEIKTRADSTIEGPETFTVRLVNDPNVFVDVDINDLD